MLSNRTPRPSSHTARFTKCSQPDSGLVTETAVLQPNLFYMNDENADTGMQAAKVTRVDLHCHSTASEFSRLGVQRAVGLPECATPPEEVYELAKRRGMDFVTITDHDTIDGVLQIADRADVFISEELTAHFRGEPQAVHVLCYGIAPADHEWLQAHRGDVEECAAYMHEREIVCALAHPYYTVAAPLTSRHRRRLADLFAIWEIRNGARARELNRPAAIYVNTRNGIGIGGSDDHAGVDIGRTFTETPPAGAPAELFEHLRAGRTLARGEQGSAAKWAHAAIALAARTLGSSRDGDHPNDCPPAGHSPDPRTVLTMAQRLLREGDARHGPVGSESGVSPADARSLLRAWLAAVGLDGLDERGLIAYMQDERFTHADLQRRACRAHERKLRAAVESIVHAVAGAGRAPEASGEDRASTDDLAWTAAATDGPPIEAHPSESAPRPQSGLSSQSGDIDVAGAAMTVFEGCIAAIPYAPAAAFLGSEKAKLDSREGELPRIAIMADGIGSTHGVSRALEEIRQRGVPGFEIEVIGTDPDVDRRLAAVAEVDVPFYPGLRIGVPALPAAVETLAEGAFDAIHVCSPGPVGIAGALVARTLGLPLLGSYHTELTAYAAERSGEAQLAQAMALAVQAFYGACDLVLSPSPASDDALAAIGVGAERVARWDRGVDTSRFDPALRGQLALRGELNVLYAGRITAEKGADLLADAFLDARRRDPRLHLVLAGGGPEQERLRARVGDEHATFLGWLGGVELARAYASADIFLFPSATDTFGQVILEAQASGLPVVAVAAGGPLSLIEDRVSGLLAKPAADALAECVLELASCPLLRRRLAAVALAEVRRRTWESAMERLADGYRRVLRHTRGAADLTPEPLRAGDLPEPRRAGDPLGPRRTADPPEPRRAGGATPGARRAA
jgi:glycosyltransferase involved in cell wall biosynthesis/predicted metal-dependent phosphoesterase TrpH